MYRVNPHDMFDREEPACTDKQLTLKSPSETNLPYGEAIIFDIDAIGSDFLIEYFVRARGSASGALFFINTVTFCHHYYQASPILFQE